MHFRNLIAVPALSMTLAGLLIAGADSVLAHKGATGIVKERMVAMKSL